MTTCHTGDRVNNYVLEEIVGTGSFGQVWRTKHHIFDELVAIKIPTDPQYVRNLQREASAIHGIRHPNVVRALDMDPYAEPPYLIMEFVQGPSLRMFIDEHPQGIPPATATTLFVGLIRTLAAAHSQNIVHRDIKPANILLTSHNLDPASITPDVVKISDFGLGTAGGVTTVSMMQSGSLLTEDGRSISGTIAYMSPEQRDGSRVDQRSDLYSAGIVLFEMLTGMRPQGGDLPSQIRQDVPKHLDKIFKRCYTRLEKRFGSAGDILNSLEYSPTSPQPSDSSDPHQLSLTTIPCEQCGSALGEGDQFCIHCGHQVVVDIPRCPSCQAFTYKEDNYCMMCGADLRTTTVVNQVHSQVSGDHN